ncbi:xanthine/uracil permease [Aurantimicrobium sp. INA4]|nr:NCS2 family permease [Aurantimicrobium sp. INA4]BDU11145.1 xanthine/uracil permease [Aurantimicrobium sp. INA4]
MSSSTTEKPKSGFAATLDRYFEITKRGSTIGTEFRGGLVIFMTMVYIIILNPIILAFSPDVNGNVIGGGSAEAFEFAPQAVASATALAAGLMTIAFGFVARLPFAIAAGLGINSFLAVTIVKDVTWQEAMGLVVIDGIIILILAVTGLRTMIFTAVPPALKTAITVGIGLFIAFIGLVDGGLVRRTDVGPVPVGLGVGTDHGIGLPTTIFIIGVLTIAVLMALRVRAAILIGLISTTVIAIIAESIFKVGKKFSDAGDFLTPFGWDTTAPGLPPSIVAVPDFSTIGEVDLFGSFERIGALAAIMLIFTLVFSNFFDAMGTMTGLSKQAGLADKDGNFPRLKSALVVEGAGAVVGGFTSTSSNTVYIESASGIAGGARTGLANIVTGVLFLVAMFFAPLTSVVPIEVGAAALVIVGALMMSQVVDIDWKDWSISFPAFLTIIMMPFTYSIANGIGIGFITWVVVRAFAGKGKEIHPILWIVAAGFVLYFLSAPLTAAFGG